MFLVETKYVAKQSLYFQQVRFFWNFRKLPFENPLQTCSSTSKASSVSRFPAGFNSLWLQLGHFGVWYSNHQKTHPKISPHLGKMLQLLPLQPEISVSTPQTWKHSKLPPVLIKCKQLLESKSLKNCESHVAKMSFVSSLMSWASKLASLHLYCWWTKSCTTWHV